MYAVTVHKLWRVGLSWNGHPSFAFSWSAGCAYGTGYWTLGSKNTSIKLSKGRGKDHTRYKTQAIRFQILWQLLGFLVLLEPETAETFFREHFSIDTQE